MPGTDLVGRATRLAVAAVRRPLGVAAYAFGVVRGAVAEGVRLAAGERSSAEPPAGPTPSAPEPRAHREPEVPREPPAQAGEPFAHEPKATSRASEHGRAHGDEDADAWYTDPVEDLDVETPVGTTGAGPGSNPDTDEADLQQPGTEPLMDPATAKSVKSESETLRRAAEREPE